MVCQPNGDVFVFAGDLVFEVTAAFFLVSASFLPVFADSVCLSSFFSAQPYWRVPWLSLLGSTVLVWQASEPFFGKSLVSVASRDRPAARQRWKPSGGQPFAAAGSCPVLWLARRQATGLASANRSHRFSVSRRPRLSVACGIGAILGSGTGADCLKA